jgi:catechol 2,3-dioxygenase-like lactoylglutathione lyase family enzyme
MMIRLHHANIRTRQLERSVAFYRDVLELTPGPAATRPGSDDHVWMRDADGVPCIHLQLGEQDGLNDRASVNHLAFACENPEAWRDKLQSLGIEHSETEFESANILQFNIVDPNGVRLELAFTCSAPPVAA